MHLKSRCYKELINLFGLFNYIDLIIHPISGSNHPLVVIVNLDKIRTFPNSPKRIIILRSTI